MIINLAGEDFAIEDKLYNKLLLMGNRVNNDNNRQDSCMNNSGNEGEGKTNGSILEAAVIKKLTGRKINLFFSSLSALKFAQSTDKQIIIVDEPVLDILSNDANTTQYKNLLRLMTTMRKKQHFVIFNFAKFWKFPEFLVVDRSLGMVHIYTKKNVQGRFLYIRKKKLELLWNAYKKHGRREYAKLKSFGGGLPYVMDKIFNKLDIRVEDVEHATLKDYEYYKDKAIESIGTQKEKTDKNYLKLLDLRKRVAAIDFKKIAVTKEEYASMLGISSVRLREWRNSGNNDPILLGKVDSERRKEPININTMDNQQEVDNLDQDEGIDDDEND